MPVTILRLLLSLCEGLAVRLANIGSRRARRDLQHTAADLLKAKEIADYVRDGDRVLDVGCGDGHTLAELSLFRAIEATGLEIAPRTRFPQIRVEPFDGERIPREDQTSDVALLGYVLHHLEPGHAISLMQEVMRVTRKRILLLEDSRPEFSFWYRLRNQFHLWEAGLEYRTSSTTYELPGDQMFMTHSQWKSWLVRFPRVTKVEIKDLGPISRYGHHTLFAVELAPAKEQSLREAA